jgi:hypothetical protein
MFGERDPKIFDNPNQVLNTEESAKVLGVSKRTLQRMGEHGPARTWISAGRVGYRVADLLEFQRNAREYGPELDVDDSVVVRNCLTMPRQPGVLEVSLDALSSFGPTLWRIAVCKHDLNDPAVPVTLQLPSASAVASAGCKEILIFDYEGMAAEAPITLVPVEGETFAGQSRAHITTAFGSLRVVPIVFAAFQKMQDTWAIA